MIHKKQVKDLYIIFNTVVALSDKIITNKSGEIYLNMRKIISNKKFSLTK